MKNIEKKDKIQREALKAWVEHGKKGTLEIITGLGKTFIGLHALYTMPRNDDEHYFLAENKDRSKDLLDQIKKYNKIFKVDVLNDYNLKFACYQSSFRWKGKKIGLIIADEIHDALSPQYSKTFFNNSYKAIIGLSATVETKTEYELPNGTIITKGDILNKVAPICFKYTMAQGSIEGTSRKLNIYVIFNKLDNKDKYIPGGNVKTRFYQTEEAAYTYIDKEHKRSFFYGDEALRKLKIRITASARSKILYNLRSKINITRELLSKLTSKTIVFGNSIDALLQVTSNVVSSRNSDAENNRIRDAFDIGKIKTIASFKKLKQGANLTELDNCIMMSYYGIGKDFIQRVGRLRDNGEFGNIFIILTQGTQEEIWFANMIKESESLNIVYCPTVDYAIKKLNE